MDSREKREQEYREKLEEEKRWLLLLSESEALKLPNPLRYQRMRYQREIEAAEWLGEIRRNMVPQEESQGKKRKRIPVNASSVIHHDWNS